jgi:hypothetical protein
MGGEGSVVSQRIGGECDGFVTNRVVENSPIVTLLSQSR